MTLLPEAPPSPWNEDGDALVGTYRGECASAPFDDVYGRLARVRAQKRWLWCGAMAPDVAVGLAIVRTGYVANVFCWVFDRARGEFLQDTSRVLPRAAVDVARSPGSGLIARYRALVEGFAVHREGDIWRIDGAVGDTHLDLEIRESAAPSTAICPVPGTDEPRRINVTRKQAIAEVNGSVRVGTRRIQLSGAAGLLDHSHGMLAGETVWQWAIGGGRFLDDGSRVGFNVVASFNDGLENTIWIDGEPSFAGLVDFEIPDERTESWAVVGDRLDLRLVPEGLRAQELDLGVVASDYLQPLGTWRGTIDGRDVELDGVAELHRSVW